METQDELLTQLATINSAIAELIAGTRLTSLTVGSGEFKRTYTYTECNLDTLKKERSNIQAKLSYYDTSTPVYRESSPLGMAWRKLL